MKAGDYISEDGWGQKLTSLGKSKGSMCVGYGKTKQRYYK